ncbi:MAG: nuclear transport factor 2 family protein [Sphingomonadaceae bacterium]|nr:nuclear transport factor 2 family protein [Sphingomonadaceae bacterium]
MTVDELLAREAIRDTLAKYNVSGDAMKTEDYAACFTRDGIIESMDREGGAGIHYEGRDAILAWQNAWKNTPKGAETTTSVQRRAKFVRHNLTTCKIDLTGPDTAKARTYWVVLTDVGPDHSGVYLDEFRKEDGQWLIAHRVVRTDWFSPDSKFGNRD